MEVIARRGAVLPVTLTQLDFWEALKFIEFTDIGFCLLGHVLLFKMTNFPTGDRARSAECRFSHFIIV